MSENYNTTPKTKNENPPFNKEEWIAKKNEERDNAFALVEETAFNLSEIENLKNYLDVQSRFDKYSVSNALLISAQKPDAKRLLDSKAWADKKALIRKGEKGIVILEPGKEFKRADGKTGTSFTTKKVFDVTQTTYESADSEPLTVNPKQLVKDIIKTSPVGLRLSETISAEQGAKYDPETRRIEVRKGADGVDIFRSVVREIVTARLAAANEEPDPLKIYCTSYIVCRRNGIEPAEYNLDSVPFAGKESKNIKAVLNEIRKEANSIKEIMESNRANNVRSDSER